MKITSLLKLSFAGMLLIGISSCKNAHDTGAEAEGSAQPTEAELNPTSDNGADTTDLNGRTPAGQLSTEGAAPASNTESEGSGSTTTSTPRED